MRATDWWDRRVVGGFMTYVLYQHWGNLSPDALEEEEIYRRSRRRATAAHLLRDVRAQVRPRGRGRALELLPRHRLARGS